MNADAASVLLAVCGWVALFCLTLVLLRREGRTGPVVTLMICLLVAAYAAGCLWEANVAGDEGDGDREIHAGAAGAGGCRADGGYAAGGKRGAGAGGSRAVDLLHAAGRVGRGCRRTRWRR